MRKSIMMFSLPLLCLTNCVNVKGIFSSNNNGQPMPPSAPTGVYTCSNGTASEGNPDGSENVESCTACNTGYTLVSGRCQRFTLHSNIVTVRCENALVGETGIINSIEYTKRSKDDITTDNASTTCTSGITNMRELFFETTFNENINSWDVSMVTNMRSMFQNTAFNQDLSSWDVSMVTDMRGMFFENPAFNQDLSGWDVSSVTNMSGMVENAFSFNQNLSGWCVSAVTIYDFFAANTPAGFTTARQPQWGSCPDCILGYVLESGTCQPAGSYTCSNGVAQTGQPSGTIDVEECSSCNTGYTLVANECSPNFSLHANMVTVLCPLASVNDTGIVNGITYTKRAVTGIDTTNADTTCTSDITDMREMFLGETSFNQNISSWDVSSVTSMEGMFTTASAFNQDISSWDVSMVTNMDIMFANATAFNQDLSGWCVSGIATVPSNFAVNNPAGFTTARQPDFASPPC